LRIPLSNVLAELVDHLSGTKTIQSKRRCRSAAVPPKPVAKSTHQRGFRTLNRRRIFADAALDQKLVEKLHAKIRVIASPFAVRKRTATAPQMATESRQCRGIDVGKADVSGFQKMTKMTDRA